MRPVALVPVLLIAPQSAPLPAPPQDFDVRGTVHDLASVQRRRGGAAGVTTGSCMFCHARYPQTTDPGIPVGSVTTYRMYDSPTMDAATPAGPTGTSLACLSCHDGVVAGQAFGGEGMSLGTDLRDDHPISIEYDPAGDPGLRSAEEVTEMGLKLFMEDGFLRVQCGTCHDPHDGSVGNAFLRIDNAGSRLCLTCHNK